jgi:hypothetical protein
MTMQSRAYNLFTTFPQKLWKTRKSALLFRTFSLLLVLFVISSCSFGKGAKKEVKTPAATDTALISLSEEEVRKRLGEPTIVSKEPDNRIIWTYRPAWKIMPDNKDTTYVEFENGKVTKVLKVR